MFKHLFILAVVLMAVLSLSTVVYAQDSEDTREVKLTSEQSMLILELQAAGKIVEADSLTRVFLNQIFLDNAAADSIQSKLDAERSENTRTLLKTGISLILIIALAIFLARVVGGSNDLEHS